MSAIAHHDAHRLYFAYGSNMDAAQMAARCGGHELVAPAVLPGCRFVINSRGVATVVPREGSVVHGIVWSISRQDEASLDRYEGVKDGFYRKERIEVLLPDGDRAEVLVYIAAEKEEGRPRNGYLAGILRAAERNGLPDGYIEELKQWG